MKDNAVINHRDTQATYLIRSIKLNMYLAELLNYQGLQKNAPPKFIFFVLEGSFFIGNSDSVNIIKQLSSTIQKQKPNVRVNKNQKPAGLTSN